MSEFVALLALLLFLIVIAGLSDGGKHSSNVTYFVSHKRQGAWFLPTGDYEKTRIFTEHEKKCYRRLVSIVAPYEWTVLSKVPACQVIKPRVHCRDYSNAYTALSLTYLDFVLCDTYLKASLVITLEAFPQDLVYGVSDVFKLDTALKYCGVQVLHTTDIDAETRTWIEERINSDV